MREGWEAPPKYFECQEAAERTQNTKSEKQTAAVHKAAQEVAKRQGTALQEQESAQLDAMWEQLDTPARERIESQAKERLGVIGHFRLGLGAAGRRDAGRRLRVFGDGQSRAIMQCNSLLNGDQNAERLSAGLGSASAQ